MHTQTNPARASSPAPAPRPAEATPDHDLTAREIAALRLFSEQVAIPLDQLARFLATERREAEGIAARLAQAGCIRQRRLLAADAPWAWPTRRGARLSGTGLDPVPPTLRWLTHRRAVNEVRLYLAERAAEGRWLCERAVERRLEPNLPKPDAVFEIGGERHAIEVELSRKSRPALRQVIASHSNRYDAVIYFCSPQTRNPLEEMRESGDWPKLLVRDVPGLQPVLASRSRGFGQPLRDRRPPRCEPWAHRRKQPRLAEPWERRILALICEQGSIPLDQLARFLACDAERVEHLAEHLCEAKFAKRAPLLAEEPDWIWLTAGGTRLSGSGFKSYLPAPGALGRLRAVNEVRLRVEGGAPQARWVGWRTLRRELRGAGRIPKAVVEIGGERHAIEVELTRKEKEEATAMIAHRSASYDAVVCFCTLQTRRFYERLQAEHHWPKLLIRRLPALDGAAPPPPRSRWSSCAAKLDWKELREAAPGAAPRRSRKLFWQPALDPQRSEVDADLWAQLEPLLAEDQRRGHAAKGRRLPDRTALSGILYVLRNDIRWPDLPHELGYGSGITCWERLRRWERDGAWPAAQRLLQARLPDAERIPFSRLAPQRPPPGAAQAG